MRRFKNKKALFYFLASMVLCTGCKDEKIDESGFIGVVSKVSHVKTSGETLYVGDEFTCSFQLKNDTDYPMRVKDLVMSVINTNDGQKVIASKSVATNVEVAAKSESAVIECGKIMTVTGDIPPSSFCRVIVELHFGDGTVSKANCSYFRVIDPVKSLITYDVYKTNYKGLTIYNQKGDMSAGFGVLKSLMSFGGGMAATMEESPQGGTYPVYATPEFLKRSIEKTVKLYNDELGANTKVKTVVIGTGVSSMAYFATTMGAVYLPIHFLAAANTSREIQSILDYSNANGYPCYSTLGYDGSMPGVGVAWIKLLDLPEEYKQFIKDHNVDQVIVYGVGEAAAGEAFARKVLRDENTPEKGYNAGDLFILYTNFGSANDISALRGRLYDYDNLNLGVGHMIADWESGIIKAQFEKISETVSSTTSASSYTLTSPTDMIQLYNISSYVMLEYMKKNVSKLPTASVNGVIFNEYLTCHPQYEAYVGYVPLIYWQFNSAESTVGRIDGYLKNAINQYFPSNDLITNFYGTSKFYLNSNMRRFELRDELVSKGASREKIFIRQSSDKWNPANDTETEEYLGIISNKVGSAEEFAYNIIDNIGVDRYVNTVKSFTPIDMTDLRRIVNLMNTGGKKNIELIAH